MNTAKNSSVIKSIYHIDDIVQVVFHNAPDMVYIYSEVPESVSIEFENAESVGRYFNENIKNKYPVRKDFLERPIEDLDKLIEEIFLEGLMELRSTL